MTEYTKTFTIWYYVAFYPPKVFIKYICENMPEFGAHSLPSIPNPRLLAPTPHTHTHL